MAAIRLATAAVVRGFQGLKSTLNEASTNHELARLIDSSALEDEVGRFRVWAGNLGALQKGHSSADYRLRDSPLLASNAQKLLKELDNNLTESIAVLSGQRLPYEQQVESLSSDGDEEDGFYSDEEDDSSEPGAPKSELEQRFRDIVDIIDNLYKLSVRIRQPTLRTRSLKAASYQPKDPETGVDILDQYAAFDLQHTKELVTHLRASHTDDVRVDGDCLVERLAKAITLRRRQFKYWQRRTVPYHLMLLQLTIPPDRAKLGHSTLSDEVELSHQLPAAVQPMVAVQRNDTLEVNVPTVHVPPLPEAVSERTGKTLLSGTEATHHHQSLDDIVDSKSVTSYATTVRDLSGKGIELPPPPKAAAGEKDFECPYCFVICPARYGRGRPWRTHLLQDLQPYLCTYAECEVTGQLFRSRREWSDHEASHRKAWRCPEHPHAVYKSRSGLAEHLDREHAEMIPQSQLESIIKIGETSTVDIRDKCPICFAVADMEGLGGLQNRMNFNSEVYRIANTNTDIAHHLERIASFSLPTLGQDEDADGGSSIASRGGSESTDWSQGLRTESSEFSFKANSTGIKESELLQNLKETSGPQHNVTPVKGTLSAETLSNLPDSSQKRLDLFLPTMSENETEDDQEEHEDTSGLEEHMAEADAFRAYLLSLPGAQSVRFYRRFGSWRGRVTFVNEASAIEAMELRNSDKTRFPDVKMRRRVANNKACLRFDIPSTSKPVEQTPGFVTEDDASVSTMSLDYNEDSHPRNASPLLSVNEIPTLRSLYRSGALVQKDQSHGPSDSYNGIISMCLYDITRLQVDCIVNSANRAMKVTRTNDSLNLFLHSAAGPELNAECRRLGRVRTGNVRLTAGYLLPCNYVIHAARPQYSTAIKHTSKLNLLAACYRNAMHTAMVQGIKTIAFPCLGAGGCGFPSRVAARIALQEVREFLDTHTDHTFERIIFCVYNRTDQKCYEHFLPVFFPPTRGDLENAVIDAKISDYSVLIEQLDSTNMQGTCIISIHRPVEPCFLQGNT
jgi:O-acetyl-ADP-ribose deacetylase (regulator of RNase III)